MVKSSKIRRLVLDILKPYEPSMTNLSVDLANLTGVDGVDIVLEELDTKVENCKITLEGTDLKMKEIKKVLEEYGASIHSVDGVSAGRKIVKPGKSMEDRKYKR